MRGLTQVAALPGSGGGSTSRLVLEEKQEVKAVKNVKAFKAAKAWADFDHRVVDVPPFLDSDLDAFEPGPVEPMKATRLSDKPKAPRLLFDEAFDLYVAACSAFKPAEVKVPQATWATKTAEQIAADINTLFDAGVGKAEDKTSFEIVVVPKRVTTGWASPRHQGVAIMDYVDAVNNECGRPSPAYISYYAGIAYCVAGVETTAFTRRLR